MRADHLEGEVWNYVCGIVKNPGSLQGAAQRDGNANQDILPENVNALRSQRQKLQHGMERLIDSLAEGLIDKDQFTSRMDRTKARLADIDAKVASQATAEDRRAHIRSAMSRLAELSGHLQPQLKKPDWATKREIIRALVQRVEIGPTNIAIVLRLPTEKSNRALEPIVVTLSRA
jgi:site-specific DNA recombinase